ncbi:MAG: hypothetical protein WC856_08205 [Methylococcaceae bacterium]|jgi:HTH-type transcriptional regulator/antitoxin HigA
MNIKPIRNDEDLRTECKRLERVYQASEGTPGADEMEIHVTLIEAYEHKPFPIGLADPVEAYAYFLFSSHGRVIISFYELCIN